MAKTLTVGLIEESIVGNVEERLVRFLADPEHEWQALAQAGIAGEFCSQVAARYAGCETLAAAPQEWAAGFIASLIATEVYAGHRRARRLPVRGAVAPGRQAPRCARPAAPVDARPGLQRGLPPLGCGAGETFRPGRLGAGQDGPAAVPAIPGRRPLGALPGRAERPGERRAGAEGLPHGAESCGRPRRPRGSGPPGRVTCRAGSWRPTWPIWLNRWAGLWPSARRPGQQPGW